MGFVCKFGCYDCCGLVIVLLEEMVCLLVKSEVEYDVVLVEWNCVYFGLNGCEVYEECLLICWLFGIMLNLFCLEGWGFEVLVVE